MVSFDLSSHQDRHLQEFGNRDRIHSAWFPVGDLGGGTLTGPGGEMIIIDDPLKPDDALSEPKRSAANQWFTNTLLSRLDDKRTGSIIIVMQRVHVDDLTGFVLEQSPDWEVLSLPAIADCDNVIP